MRSKKGVRGLRGQFLGGERGAVLARSVASKGRIKFVMLNFIYHQQPFELYLQLT